METRALANSDRFKFEKGAERDAKYLALGRREPDAQDVDKVIPRAKKILRRANRSRYYDGTERKAANSFFEEAMKTGPKEACKVC